MYTITKLVHLGIKTPEPRPQNNKRTFAVMQDNLFVRRFVTNSGHESKKSLEPTHLGGGQFAHYELVQTPEEATEFLTRSEAGMLHSELRRPGWAIIVCVYYHD